MPQVQARQGLQEGEVPGEGKRHSLRWRLLPGWQLRRVATARSQCLCCQCLPARRRMRAGWVQLPVRQHRNSRRAGRTGAVHPCARIIRTLSHRRVRPRAGVYYGLWDTSLCATVPLTRIHPPRGLSRPERRRRGVRRAGSRPSGERRRESIERTWNGVSRAPLPRGFDVEGREPWMIALMP
jgi:hypothetical protein